MAAKFFTGLPLDGPDPECVQGYGAEALRTADGGALPRPALDHSHRGPVRARGAGPVPVPVTRPPRGAGPVPVAISPRPPSPRPATPRPPSRACDEDPLSGFAAG